MEDGRGRKVKYKVVMTRRRIVQEEVLFPFVIYYRNKKQDRRTFRKRGKRNDLLIGSSNLKPSLRRSFGPGLFGVGKRGVQPTGSRRT